MSSAAGPMVPVRTGSWLLRPLAPSLSSNAFSVLLVMSTAAIPCGVGRALRARRTTGQVYMTQAPNQGAAGYSPVGAGSTLSGNGIAPRRALLHDLDEISGLGLTLGVQAVHEAQLLLLELLDRHVLGVVLDLGLLARLDELQPIGLGERIFRGFHVAHRLDRRHEDSVIERRAGLARAARAGDHERLGAAIQRRP